jgi:putative flavoprotein involved in K+ transport
MRPESIETVVIGAGQAGLAASYCLSARGREHLVLERGRVGEAWRSQRWDGFYLNTPNWSQLLPGCRYEGPDPDAFASLREVISRLEQYAKSFASPVREGVEVTRVRRDGNAFRVESHGNEISAEHVIVAAGAYQRPTPTPLLHALPAEIQRWHTSEYRRPSQLPPGAVLVIGSGQSGCQIAEELLAADREVYLSVSRCPWVPRRYRGRDVMYWNVETGLAEMTVDTLPTPEARLMCNPPVSGNDGGHDCNPRWLAKRGAVLIGRVVGIDGWKVRLGSGLEESLAAGDKFVAELKQRADEAVLRSKLDVGEPEPEEEKVPALPIAELDLRAAGVRSVIWANGFRPDHSWIEGVETDPQGWPIQQRGVVTGIPGLYFVGLHWLHKRKSSLFLGVGEDAEYVASHLADRTARTR